CSVSSANPSDCARAAFVTLNSAATVSTSTWPLLDMNLVVVLNSTATERVLIVLTDFLTATRPLLPTARRTPAARFLDRDMDFATVHSFAGKPIHYSRQSGSIQILSGFSPKQRRTAVAGPVCRRAQPLEAPALRWTQTALPQLPHGDRSVGHAVGEAPLVVVP